MGSIQISFEVGPYMTCPYMTWIRLPDWKYVIAKHRSAKWEDVESIFVELQKDSSFFFSKLFLISWIQSSELCMEESMLSGDQVHLIPCLPKGKVHDIHDFGLQVMKLQGTIFLLLDINVCQPAFSSKLHLAFLSVHMEMSVLPSPFFLWLGSMILRYIVQPVLSFISHCYLVSKEIL